MDTGYYLDSFLAPLAPWLERSDITDIWINRPGEVWIEAIGGGILREEVPRLDEATLSRLARQIAAHSSQGINRTQPLLAATLPDGSRVQVVAPPATRAVRGRRNILVSGGTSSGKTTFLNALLAEIPEHERLVLIEDTAELRLVHENAVGLIAARSALGEADVTVEDLLIAALRLRPDRIILGELRGAEAFSFLRAVNTGHPGSMTTIHADSPGRAIEQLVLLVLQGGSRLSRDDVRHYVRESVDVYVQLAREPGRRGVSQVLVAERNGA